MARTMSKCFGAAVIAGGLLVLLADDPPLGKPAPTATTGAKEPAAKNVIQQFCLGCHNAQLKTAGLVLDPVEIEHIGEHSNTWEKVARKLRTGEMPPAG